MKKIYFLAFLFLCTFLTIGTNTAWGETAAVGDILWAENFAHFETNTPSDAKTGTGTTIFGGATITYSQSSTSTKGYNDELAGGTAPELLLAKDNTTWTISGIPTGGATEMRLTFLSNRAAFGLTTTTQNLTISGKEKTWTIQVKEGKTAPETFNLTLKNTASKNARIDNVSIVVVTAASSVSEKVSLVYNANGSTGGTVPATAGYDKGATVTVAGNTGGLVKTGFDFAGWNTSADGSGTTYQGGNTFTINANTTLYAIWTAQSNKLSTPTNLKTTDITSNSAKLSWDAVPHATKYIVTYAETNSSVTSTTYVLSGLLPNTHYLWTVKAVGDATYEDSEKSSTAEFTTLPTPYTITWSTPDGTDTKQVTPGDKVVLPTTDPTSCSSTYTNFVGWFTEAAGSESNPSATKPATQVTAATVPTGDATYYAVFSDGAESETTLNIPNNTLIGSLTASYSDKSFSVNGYSFNLNACKQNDYCQMRDNNTISYIEIPTLPGRITKISTSDCKNASGSAYNGTLHLKTTKTRGNSDKNDIAKVTYSSVSSFSWDLSTTNATSGFLVTSEGLRLKDLSITYLATTPATGYISFCTPYIKGTDDITVTSAKGVWVEAVTPLNITATNLDKNADGANVTITATSLTDGFTLKTQGTNGSDSESVTLETGYSNSTYNANLTVVYSPTADSIIEEGKIALRVYSSTNGTSTYATDTIIVRGRSLPAEFVLAAETTNGWVALPADLGTSSTDAVKEPYTISVDDNAAPTKATLAPQSALYSAAMRSTVNTIPTGLRFAAGEKYLRGSQSEGETKVWLSSSGSEQMQLWELHSSNLADYFVRLHAAEAGRYLSYNATQGKIANYKQESRLRILPVENICVRYDAPNINVHALISTSVTFVWEAIAGVTDYEYSLDNEQTWQTCSDIETLGTEVKWTLANLKSETKYTVYIRAKVADGKSNCSDYDTETFTTPTCDDVPVDLWVSPTANAATIMWSAKAPTATVKIYADEQGTNLVKETPNATTPCKIIGLEQNTDYYYQVLAGGSCASAIAHFKTESNEVSIVEWKKDAVIVDLNTEVTDADEVSILVEGQKTHGTNNNVADDLFFSKYYEASGNVKLVAIYNGTKDTLSLANVKIKLGVTAWNTNVISMSDYGRYKHGFIAPNEEIIVWYYNGSFDQKIVKCVKDKMNINILNENSAVSFSGKQTFALVRDSKIIDIMGAIDTKDTDVDKVKPIEGGCKPEWGDITKNDAVARTWCGEGYSIEDKTTLIDLAMNRCLLVRSNKVKSGAKAVANNVGAFKTFTKDEWLGRQVTEGDDNGCHGILQWFCVCGGLQLQRLLYHLRFYRQSGDKGQS